MASNDSDDGEKTIKRGCKNFLDQLKLRNDEACANACAALLEQYHKEIMQGLNCSLSIKNDSEGRPVFEDLS